MFLVALNNTIHGHPTPLREYTNHNGDAGQFSTLTQPEPNFNIIEGEVSSPCYYSALSPLRLSIDTRWICNGRQRGGYRITKRGSEVAKYRIMIQLYRISDEKAIPLGCKLETRVWVQTGNSGFGANKTVVGTVIGSDTFVSRSFTSRRLITSREIIIGASLVNGKHV